MNISDHPIWNQVTPYNTKISSIKKPFHLLRISLARQYTKLFKRDTFIGVTGSVGKTTCVEACLEILSEKYKTLATTPSLDPILNIPITILKMTPSIKKVILEMGVEYKGDMDIYLSIVHPKVAIVTKIFYAHSEFLGNIEEIIQEKGKLVAQLPSDGVAILNGDDPNCRKLADLTNAQIIYFGKEPKINNIWAGNIRIENFMTIFELNYGVERVKVEYQLLGEHQVYPALAAAALGIKEGIAITTIKRALERVTAPPHRLSPMEGFNGSVILDDSYNSSPAAVEGAIDTLMEITAKRRILVLGEMRELGRFSERLHRNVAQKIYKERVDLVFLGTGETSFIADELNTLGFLPEKLDCNLQNPQLVSKLLKILSKGDVCLIKGSRALRLDEVVKRVAKK